MKTPKIYHTAAAVCEAHCGNSAAAKKRARTALELAKGRDVVYAAAFALALSGEDSESLRLAADLDKRFPEDTPVQFEYLPILQVLDHRGVVVANPIGALAHLQLGRAYVMSGDKMKAKRAYQDFLTLWKDTDADIPVLKQASAEYAKL